MKIRLVGDHSDYHCGSRAVADFMRGELEPLGALVEGADFDLLVVNGSMHDDSKACRGKMQEIGAALDAGKRVWLVNTVWQANSLARCTGDGLPRVAGGHRLLCASAAQLRPPDDLAGWSGTTY